VNTLASAFFKLATVFFAMFHAPKRYLMVDGTCEGAAYLISL
jgi:hypothetical protein